VARAAGLRRGTSRRGVVTRIASLHKRDFIHMTETNDDAPIEAEFESLLEYLKHARGFDFSGYKRPSLARRVQKRMQATGVPDFAAYLDYLEVHPDEFEQLFNTVLINVTSFFRDPEAWKTIDTTVIPHILASKPEGAPIRVWSAACATGEEAYSIAMLLAEALGLEQFHERVKVYATDVDEEALAKARAASYGEREVKDVPPALLERYFDRIGDRFVFKSEPRRAVIFGRHDLTRDAPISKVDLLACRNALMYFNAEAQARIISRFHFALADGGFLFLGRAETLLAHTALFSATDLKRRVFAKVPRVQTRDRLADAASRFAAEGPALERGPDELRMRDVVFDVSPVAQVVVDAQGTLAMANERARALFGLGRRDIGRPIQDLELSYRPVELRSLIQRVYADGRPLTVQNITHGGVGAGPRSLSLVVSLVSDGAATPLGVSVAFTDVTENRRLQAQLEQAHQELEAAYEELQSTNEELETTNEELQSTVEELETTNEELQSTNEELETMNEELQSTNEELQTINDEVRRRSEQVDELNAFLEAVLGSLRGGVIAVDRNMRVTSWNGRSEELWGARAAEVVGKSLLALDIGLPVELLTAGIRGCLTGDGAAEPTRVVATNRRGRTVECTVTCSPLASAGDDGAPRGVILLVE
jgi:two-component system CheB/CheR fusion protein